jgi:hypothetical protein
MMPSTVPNSPTNGALLPLGLERRGLVILDRVGPVARVQQAGAHHRGLHRSRAGELDQRGLCASALQGAQCGGDPIARRPLLDEEPDPVDHHRDRGEAERDQEPQHPARARAQHEVEKLGVDRIGVGHGSPCSCPDIWRSAV